jgi:hypothetical protein
LVDTYATFITLFKILTETEFGQQIISTKKTIKPRKPAQWVTDVTKLTAAFSKRAANAPPPKKKDCVFVNPTVELMLMLGASSDNKFIHKYFYRVTGRFDNLNM